MVYHKHVMGMLNPRVTRVTPQNRWPTPPLYLLHVSAYCFHVCTHVCCLESTLYVHWCLCSVLAEIDYIELQLYISIKSKSSNQK